MVAKWLFRKTISRNIIKDNDEIERIPRRLCIRLFLALESIGKLSLIK
jgi:hypothetical protein